MLTISFSCDVVRQYITFLSVLFVTFLYLRYKLYLHPILDSKKSQNILFIHCDLLSRKILIYYILLTLDSTADQIHL